MRALFAAIVAVVTGCQGSQGQFPSAPRPPLATTLVKQIDVTPSKQVVAPGRTLSLVAAVYMLDGQITANVNWASSDDTVATVDGSGLVTAIKEGLVTITARSAVEPKRFGICTLLVSTCASCSVPLPDRVDAGSAITESERSALNAALQDYKLEAATEDRSYLLNRKGQVPEREYLHENESWTFYEEDFPSVITEPRTTWLSSYVAVSSNPELVLSSAGHFATTVYPSKEVGGIDTAATGVRVLFYKWDGSWVKDMKVTSGRRLFIDDLPVGEGLIGRVVLERYPVVYEAWSKPFVLSANRTKLKSPQYRVIPQLDFHLKVGSII